MIVVLLFLLSFAAAEPVTRTIREAAETAVDDVQSNESRSLETSEEGYAPEFPYLEPQPQNVISERSDNTARRGRSHVRIIHRWGTAPKKPKTYAKKYRTWMPAKKYIKPVRVKYGPPRKPSRPHRRANGPHRRRKFKPTRPNNLQRPKPPPEVDYDYLADEDFFPEETNRNELKYNERIRPPQNNRGKRRKPERNVHEDRYRPDDENRSVSYSNFVQHPTSSTGYDYDYFEDEEPKRTKQKSRRKKKKKSKTEKKRPRDEYEDQSGSQSESLEDSTTKNYDRYPPYAEDTVLRPSRHPQVIQQTPIYGEGYLGTRGGNGLHQNFINRLSNTADGPERVRQGANSNIQLYRSQEQVSPNFIRPVQDIVTQSPFNQFQNHVPVNVPNFNNPHQQTVNTFSQPTTFSQNYFGNPNVATSNVPSYSSVSNLGNGYSSRYKATSFFDNTDTFQDFNSNVNHQQNRFGAQQGRPNNFTPSREFSELESDFINRHLDLYSQGMKGVPVQGDGFGDAKQSTRTKDYDIGYGEVHYDESHNS